MVYYSEWLICLAIGIFAIGCILGFSTDYVAKAKGLPHGFAWGFWLGIVGLLVVGFLPAISSKQQNSVQPVSVIARSGDARINPSRGAVSLCEQPGIGVLTWIPSDEKVQIIGEVATGDWMKVQYSDYIGYVKKEDLLMNK